jgi:DnaJ-class molecular chaperone
MHYYVVLGIAEDADEERIRSAFRGAGAPLSSPGRRRWRVPMEFQRAREAYETLANPELLFSSRRGSVASRSR